MDFPVIILKLSRKIVSVILPRPVRFSEDMSHGSLVVNLSLEAKLMKIEKRIISKLNKCYAITRLTYQGKPAFLVAAERHDPCYLFSEDGERLDTV